MTTTAPDWGHGAYEVFAPDLIPAAEHLVRIAAPIPGEHAVDLGCGTGNATLPLAATGAQVTAVDPSLRLLGIAAERARAARHRITTSVASAEAIPLPGEDAGLVISNFGVIFSADPVAAIREVLRILVRDGRFVYSAWRPDGALAELRDVLQRETSRKMQAQAPADAADAADPADTPPIAWSDPSTFAHLVPGGTDAITVHEASTDFVADSAASWIETQEAHHPMWLSARALLDDETAWRAAMDESVAILEAASTERDRMVVPSPYVVVEVRPKY